MTQDFFESRAEFVTVVSGVPRSGTSLMMQMLAAGGMPLLTDGIRRPDESNPRGYFEFEPAKRTGQNSTWVRQASGKAVKVIYALLRDLPAAFDYRVILMQRDLREVAASQRAMLKGSAASDERIAAVFERELTDTRDWLSAQANFSVLEVHYRDCLAHPAAEAVRVNAFLGSRLNEGAMASAVDESLYRRSSTTAALS